MKLFKILIPSGSKTEVTELESWKVSWKVSTSMMWGDPVIRYKCFVDEKEAKLFKSQLEESASFIGTPISTELVKN